MSGRTGRRPDTTPKQPIGSLLHFQTAEAITGCNTTVNSKSQLSGGLSTDRKVTEGADLRMDRRREGPEQGRRQGTLPGGLGMQRGVHGAERRFERSRSAVVVNERPNRKEQRGQMSGQHKVEAELRRVPQNCSRQEMSRLRGQAIEPGGPQKQRETDQTRWLERHVAVPPEVIAITKESLPDLETAFRSSKVYSEFSKLLSDCLAVSESLLYWTILHLVSLSSDYTKYARNDEDTVTSFLVRGFRDYLGQLETRPQMPSSDLKLAALLVAFNQEKTVVLKTIVAVFCLSEESVMYLPFVKRALLLKLYKVATQAIVFFKLQSHFTPKEIAFPLLLQKNFKALMWYVGEDVALAKLFVTFLDRFCCRGAMSNQSKLSDDEKRQLNASVIKKHVKRCTKKFNMPIELWPNVKHISDIDTLRFILSTTYSEELMDTCDDFVTEFVGNSRDLQMTLVFMIATSFKDVNGAAYFAVKFRLPLDRVPYGVTIAVQSGNCKRITRDARPFEDVLCCLQHSVSDGLPRYIPNDILTRMVHVNEPETFKREMENLLKIQNDNVAIDCEWKPVFDSTPVRLALMQIATKDNVFLVDVFAMGSNLRDEHWSSFRDLLCNKSVCKLGFSFGSDFATLAEASPVLKNLSTLTNGLIDMSILCNNVMDKFPDMFPYYSGTVPKKRGLGFYAQLCFGRSLDKTQQMSNWERRPLNPHQVIYAGIDAYCLVEMYRVLQDRAQEFGVDLSLLTTENSSKDKEDETQVHSKEDIV